MLRYATCVFLQVKISSAIASCGEELCPCPPMTGSKQPLEDGKATNDDDQSLPIYNVNNTAAYNKADLYKITDLGFVCTDMAKKMGHRLRDISPAALGSQGAGSRNLWPAYLIIPEDC